MEVRDHSLTLGGCLQSAGLFDAYEWYTGVSKQQQLTYIGELYEEMRKNSNNDYIVPWNKLGEYNGVVGYYLYSNDFEAQCGSAGFSVRKGNKDGYVYKPGFKIKNDGTIKEGYYEVRISSDTARTSFVVNDEAGATRTLVLPPVILICVL